MKSMQFIALSFVQVISTLSANSLMTKKSHSSESSTDCSQNKAQRSSFNGKINPANVMLGVAFDFII